MAECNNFSMLKIRFLVQNFTMVAPQSNLTFQKFQHNSFDDNIVLGLGNNYSLVEYIHQDVQLVEHLNHSPVVVLLVFGPNWGFRSGLWTGMKKEMHCLRLLLRNLNFFRCNFHRKF